MTNSNGFVILSLKNAFWLIFTILFIKNNAFGNLILSVLISNHNRGLPLQYMVLGAARVMVVVVGGTNMSLQTNLGRVGTQSVHGVSPM